MSESATWLELYSDSQLFIKETIVARLRVLAGEMEQMAVYMDYYGGFAELAKHSKELAGAGQVARQWADEIEASEIA